MNVAASRSDANKMAATLRKCQANVKLIIEEQPPHRAEKLSTCHHRPPPVPTYPKLLQLTPFPWLVCNKANDIGTGNGIGIGVGIYVTLI